MRTTQGKVIERLEKETLRSFDVLSDAGLLATQKVWEAAKDRMRDAISRIYMDAFKSSTWNIVEASRMGLLRKIDMAVGAVLSEYHDASIRVVGRALRDIYRDAALRHVWMLDQTTPPNIKVKLPEAAMFREAAAPATYRGPDADTTWKVRWAAWTDAYRDSLYQNLRLGALNESTVADARDEVDATRPGSPQSDMWDSFKRILGHQSEVAFTMAAADVVAFNPDLGAEEIWQTRYYDRVCEVCADNAGKTRDEVDDDIPAHPNCGCYWRVVPKSWASLLRSGSDQDRKLAAAIDAHGEVPNSMLVFNDDGDLVGSVVVKFNEWVADHEESIRGGVQ